MGRKYYLAKLEDKTLVAIREHNKKGRSLLIVMWSLLAVFTVSIVALCTIYLVRGYSSFIGISFEFIFVGVFFITGIPLACVFGFEFWRKRHISNPKLAYGIVRSSMGTLFGYQTFVAVDKIAWLLPAYSGVKYDIGTRVEVEISDIKKHTKCRIIAVMAE